MLDFLNKQPLINTPLQRGGRTGAIAFNRFSGFPGAVTSVETAKAVERDLCVRYTPLKRGVNESGSAQEA